MMMTIIYLAFFVSFVFSIMGGEYRVQYGTTKFMISIGNERLDHFCSGVLIKRKFVMTAATCVQNRQPDILTLVAGIINLNQNGTNLYIDKIFRKDPTGRDEVHNGVHISHYCVLLRKFLRVNTYTQ